MTNYLTTALAATGTGANPPLNVRLSELVLTIYSKDIMFQAAPALRFDQFATVKTDLSATPGKGITFFKYNNLTPGGALVEGYPMQTQALAGSQINIVVQEYGNAVAVSNLLLATSFIDVMSGAARLLGDDYARVVDGLAMNVLIDGAGSDVFADNSTDIADIDTGDYLTMEEIKDGVEILATNNSPKVNNDHWVCVLHPHQSRNLRDDPDWITVGKLDPQRLYNGEIGRCDDVVFIETTNVDVTAQESTTPTLNIYTALLFGDNAFGKAVALPVEMRDNGVVDFGRERDLAWYSIFGMGIINEDNVVAIRTA